MRFANERTFDGLIGAAATRYGVPVWLIKAVIGVESSFNPKAYNKNDPGGARGLMQITAATARGLGYTKPLGQDAARSGGLYDPAVNIDLGTKLLAELLQTFPDQPFDVIYAAYNGGPRAGRKMQEGVVVNPPAINRWRSIASTFQRGYEALRSSLPFQEGPPEDTATEPEKPATVSPSRPPSGPSLLGPSSWAPWFWLTVETEESTP